MQGLKWQNRTGRSRMPGLYLQVLFPEVTFPGRHPARLLIAAVVRILNTYKVSKGMTTAGLIMMCGE